MEYTHCAIKAVTVLASTRMPGLTVAHSLRMGTSVA